MPSPRRPAAAGVRRILHSDPAGAAPMTTVRKAVPLAAAVLIVVSLLATVPATDTSLSGRSSPKAPSTTGVLQGSWVGSLRTAGRGLVNRGLTLQSSQPLHDASVSITSTGPIEAKHRGATPIGTLARGTQTVQIPVELRGAGDGTLAASVTGIDSAGTRVSDVTDLAFAAEPSGAVFSTDGVTAARLSLLELDRASLGSATYQQDLNDIEGGGATVHVSTSKTIRPHGGATTEVDGTIQYAALDTSTHPARDVAVQVWDASSGSPVLVTTTWANDAGQFDTSVTTNVPNTTTPRQLFIRALAEDDVSVSGTPDGTAAFVVHAPPTAGTPNPGANQLDSSVNPIEGGPPVYQTATGNPLSFTITATSQSDNNALAFELPIHWRPGCSTPSSSTAATASPPAVHP